ncbi:hypothetical protein [Bradyrhizobium sp. SZCCHNR1051]|uniref:hypothetical protein n=1 Tax=Bradyrhizobium sp. SZCCHNR1051 TaxID=3057355 RepID=UPI0029171436|nr:hypothetical protein [Bradyrhizobium sp. SZCCHNR1051]
MNASDVARRFERRHGYDLIDYAEVALPLYRLTVDAITIVHHGIPPIKEFVMRCVALGLASAQEVGGFLGIDATIAAATLNQLRTERYITSDEEGSVGLTSRGREVLDKAMESAPQDEMLVFLYDRLLLKPVKLPPEQLLVPANIDAKKVIEIRPYPAEGPEIEQVALPDVLQVLAQQAGGRDVLGRDLLRLKRIVRRVRLYRLGVALVYKKYRSSEIQIAFIVDEARNEALEHAFAERGGPKKMGFLKAIDESAALSDLRRYLGPDILKKVAEQESLEEKRLAVSLARIKHQAALTKAERKAAVDPSGDTADREAVALAAQTLADAEAELVGFAARPVAPFEIAEFLEAAFERCESQLFASSRVVDRSVVDSSFMKRLEKLLSRGVRVRFTLREPPKPESPVIELERLNKRYANLQITTGGRGSQFHHLVCDDKFALISNRPMLGNLGKVRSFTHVVGYVLQQPELVLDFTRRLDGAVGREEQSE